ncbi:1363_t:CDS:2 [Acaulospora morrowiae]|uniref:1363_t:CDS:1 n=1 Tax=Acaulospora morrowiae TaxID=94023 RepID=A0A9N9HG31_9GLOM|nr:1363_t:CDS:2 [Acaulospora morrowiae]
MYNNISFGCGPLVRRTRRRTSPKRNSERESFVHQVIDARIGKRVSCRMSRRANLDHIVTTCLQEDGMRRKQNKQTNTLLQTSQTEEAYDEITLNISKPDHKANTSFLKRRFASPFHQLPVSSREKRIVTLFVTHDLNLLNRNIGVTKKNHGSLLGKEGSILLRNLYGTLKETLSIHCYRRV